ncbi:MAG: Na+/H+ antiporter subunit E [Rickettsiales bacterium]|nr:Na+/H+ antiporter subunit E [Pseudomonadota bacterium]MDA0967264.1 Na+/H+ antiporter subunit E [Pseudomonadota bacterium]MDG4544075.1 Na+/H+ antiporter subunit E [Rickettsiales bacterium]MDG4546231.1 Na+/H+ antiporter subunit E [Rickettsiales bacterium]MDG4548399.1 Na+/H+ antiporter subunit E [Rickettsiales bacterium]
MLNKIVLFLILFATWLVMSGMFKPFFIILGALSCLLAVIFYSLLDKNKTEGFSAIGLLFRGTLYSVWLIKEIILAAWDVTAKIWQLEPDISPEMAWVNTSLKNDISMTILGNSITLTPGTVTVDINEEGMFQVHALTKAGLDDVRSGRMLEKVIKVMK